MKKVSVYVLKCPKSLEVKYVGKTVDTKKRLIQHLCEAKKEGKKNVRAAWINSLLSDGVSPIMEVLEVCDDNAQACLRERFFISKFKSEGYNLKNRTEGGDGNSPGYEFTKRFVNPKGKQPEHLTKFNGKVRRNWTEEQRKDWSKVRKGAVSENRKPVDIINLETGETITIESIKAASEYLGININRIVKSCKHKAMIFNKVFTAVYSGSGMPEKIVTPQKIGVTCVEKLGTIREFDCILNASKFYKISRNTITNCIKNETKDKNEHTWKKTSSK